MASIANDPQTYTNGQSPNQNPNPQGQGQFNQQNNQQFNQQYNQQNNQQYNQQYGRPFDSNQAQYRQCPPFDPNFQNIQYVEVAPPKPSWKAKVTLRLFALIFAAISLAAFCGVALIGLLVGGIASMAGQGLIGLLFFIPLAWIIPLFFVVLRYYQGKREMTIAMSVVILIFCSMVSGSCILAEILVKKREEEERMSWQGYMPQN